MLRPALLSWLGVLLAAAGTTTGDVGAAEERPQPIFFESFEESSGPRPAEWHAVRRGQIVGDDAAPDGAHALRFACDVPGLDAGARRTLPLDGRQLRGLEAAVWVRTTDVSSGQFSEQRPAVELEFYDERGRSLERQVLGSWQGTCEWTEATALVPVPRQCRTLVVRLGLFGATGEARFDALMLLPARINESVFPE
jgi:protein-L-isoaspartate(D-aspartate) O-methyltransferase